MYFYGADSVEFGTLAMLLSGLCGSCMYFVLNSRNIELVVEQGSSKNGMIILCIISGSFTALASFTQFKAISVGSAEITQLVVNTKIIVQMVEEIIIFHLIPGSVALIGMAGVFIGVTMMICTKEKKNLTYHDDNYYARLQEK